jgi:hypothetical protein
MSDLPNVRFVDFHFRYHDEEGDSESEVAPVISTDFLSGHDSIEDIRFNGGWKGLHSPDVKSIDLAGVSRLPKLRLFALIDLYNVKWLDLSPLSRARRLEDISITTFTSRPLLFRRISLAELGSSQTLRTLTLYANCLDDLDLSPLDGSSSLERLRITNVDMHIDKDWEEYVDKSPADIMPSPADTEDKMIDLRVPRCENLEALSITETSRTSSGQRPLTSKFKEIDLTNLAYCEDFRHLQIVGQGVFQLDLSPLREHQSLDFIHVLENDNLKEIDISPIIPMAHGLRECRFDKYVTHSVFDESAGLSVDVQGPPIRYLASREMEVYYDDTFRRKFRALGRSPRVMTLIEEPIDIEWY